MLDNTISSSRHSYAGLAQLFLATREENGCAPITIQNYRQAIARFTGAAAIPADPGALTSDHITLWLAELRTGGMPAPSRQWTLRHVKPFLRWAYRRRVFRDDPLRDAPRVHIEQRILPQVVPEDMVRLLTAAADRPRTKQGNRVTVEHQARNIALVRVLWSTGLRRREILALTLADLNLDRRELRVMGKGGRERIVPFDASTKVALLEYLLRERGREPGPLFLSRGGVPMTPNALVYMLRRLEARAGCNHVTPHAFRRGFARHTRRAGLDLGEVAALMGHSQLTMTMRYSQAGEAEAARDAYRRLIG